MLPNVFGQPVPRVAAQRSAVRRLEQAGYSTLWMNEGLGSKDGLVQLGLLFAATDQVTIASGVTNVWARPPETAHGGAAMLAEAYDDRLVLGIGIGYTHQAELVGGSLERPLHVARDYVRRMTAEVAGMPTEPRTYPLLLAANGPQMLRLAGEITDGAIPASTTPEHTAMARTILGQDKLIAVGMICVLDDDEQRAHAAAREFVTALAGGAPAWITNNLARLGYSHDEIASGADRLVNALVPHGNADSIADGAARHLAAGADHVRIDLKVPDFDTGIEQLLRLSDALRRLQQPAT